MPWAMIVAGPWLNLAAVAEVPTLHGNAGAYDAAMRTCRSSPVVGNLVGSLGKTLAARCRLHHMLNALGYTEESIADITRSILNEHIPELVMSKIVDARHYELAPFTATSPPMP